MSAVAAAIFDPLTLMPHKLQWNPDRAQTAAVARFVHLALTVKVPAGWHTQPGHLRHGRTRRG